MNKTVNTTEILLQGIRDNLRETGDARVLDLALRALGHDELAERILTDLDSLQAIQSVADKDMSDTIDSDGVEGFFQAADTKAPYTDELLARRDRFWETARAVTNALQLN